MTRWVEGGGQGELGVGGDEKEAPQRVTVTRRESLTSGHPVGGFFWLGVGGEWGGGDRGWVTRCPRRIMKAPTCHFDSLVVVIEV